MTDIIFVTGNQNKADYLTKLLEMPMQHHKIDLDELQSTDLKEIVEHKVRQAYEKVQKPVLVEDISFGFRALNGLPGPFIKFFLQPADGPEKLCRILDSFDDRRATAECAFGYFDGKRLEFLVGRLDGVVADHPRGENGFGWDAIFCPDGYDGRTRAELSNDEYDELYPTIRPVAALRALLQEIQEDR
ncbi:MAG TPA: non-canonical purine NTP pyrophosphatase [Candidatus Saccharimonadales bacterium]|nr:non-canonical purine NTP pyrophosphatase [Candidatus Saccharimonadales bacterium]